MARKLLVEMEPLEYSRFQLFERLLKRLHDKNPQATDAKIGEIIEGSLNEILNPAAKEPAKK